MDNQKSEWHENAAFEGESTGSTDDTETTEIKTMSSKTEDTSSSSSSLSRADYEQKETTIEFCSLTDQYENENHQADTKLGDLPDGHLEQNLRSFSVGSPCGTDKLYAKEDEIIEEKSTETSLYQEGGLRYRGDEFTISWRNLDYVVQSQWYKLASQRKPILDGLSGSFKSGELSAVLGPSGAGKSTLIDCLMGKRQAGTSGQTRVTFRDSACEQERRQRRPLRIATIPQDDHLLDSLTVTETFMFASKIKNAHLSYADEEENQQSNYDDVNKDSVKKTRKKPFDHFANVQRVIQQLNLSSCASLRCAKLSGGQYKRVSIGQELLSRPDLMILDEPTSGLDSVTCYQTINALRQLIDSSPYPMAIVATIHQPDIEVLNLFHKAYVLASGGRAIYEGPTSKIFDTVKLGVKLMAAKRSKSGRPGLSRLIGKMDDDLTDLRAQLEARTGNPGRLIVELAANEHGYEITSALNELHSMRSQQHEKPVITEVYNRDQPPSSPTPSTSSDLQLEPTTRKTPPPFDYDLNNPSRRKADLDDLLSLVSANMNQRRSFGVYLKHLVYHTQRSWVTIVRDPMLFSVQVALHILVPLLISYSFQGRRGDACPRVGPLDVLDEAYRSGNVLNDLNRELRIEFENLGYMFFQIYVIIFAAVCVTSLTYPLAMHVLLKEYRNGWYSMSSYFLGRTLADLPVPTFNVVLAMAISYHLTGQPLSPYAWRFTSVATLTVLATLVAQTMGLMFGALLMNLPQSAVFVAPASTAPLVVVSGFLIRIQSLPGPLQFLSKFSYFTHLLNGFIVSRYGFNRCPCKDEDFIAEESHQIPSQAKAIIDLWVESFGPEYNVNFTSVTNDEVNLVGKLLDTISSAKTFNFNITDCSQVKPFTMLDYQLEDSDLGLCFVALFIMLIVFRLLTYIVLAWKIKSSI